MTPTEPRSRGVEADVLLPTERELLADSRAYFEANESRFRSREEALVGVIERLVPLLTAAEARGREQERTRLAALSPGEIGEMVAKLESYGFECEAGPLTMCRDWTALLAAFAAQRERVVGECAEVCDAAESELILASQRAQEQGESELMCSRADKADCAGALAGRIRALLAAPTKGETP